MTAALLRTAQASPRLRALLRAPLLRFVVVGGVNTVLTFVLFLGLLRLLGRHPGTPAVAQATSYISGMGLSFAANRLWTFRDVRGGGLARGQMARFAVAHAGSLSLSAILMEAGVTRAGLAPALCSLLLLVPITVLNYTTQRFWVFRARPARQDSVREASPCGGAA